MGLPFPYGGERSCDRDQSAGRPRAAQAPGGPDAGLTPDSADDHLRRTERGNLGAGKTETDMQLAMVCRTICGRQSGSRRIETSHSARI